MVVPRTKGSTVNFSIGSSENIVTDKQINANIRSLQGRSKYFLSINRLEINVKYKLFRRKKDVERVHLFIFGEKGCGKTLRLL